MALIEDVQPKWINGLPYCDEECPSYDGKRCEKLGHKPDAFCEPTLITWRDKLAKKSKR